MAPSSHIMILAGEPSGDVHGAALVKTLKAMDPDLEFSGIGGDAMAAEGMALFFHIDELSAMGLIEVIVQLRTISRAFRIFKSRFRSTRPGLLILIDYPGFNLKAAQFAKAHTSVKVLYYITPKVWAWNQGRLHTIRRCVDHAALIFPFEEKLYRQYRVPATYVGNPLMDAYPDPVNTPAAPGGRHLRPDSEPLCIGLLPGSRNAEINALLDLMLQSGRMIRDRLPGTRFLVSAADSVPLQKIETILAPYNGDNLFCIVPGNPCQIFNRADLVIAASGTVTLEAALCCVPTIIVYKMSPITHGIAKLVVKVKFAGLANIIAGREVMPELLQDDATPRNICRKAISMAKDLPFFSARLQMVRRLLGSAGATRRAARIALDLLKRAH